MYRVRLQSYQYSASLLLVMAIGFKVISYMQLAGFLSEVMESRLFPKDKLSDEIKIPS